MNGALPVTSKQYVLLMQEPGDDVPLPTANGPGCWNPLLQTDMIIKLRGYVACPFECVVISLWSRFLVQVWARLHPGWFINSMRIELRSRGGAEPDADVTSVLTSY